MASEESKEQDEDSELSEATRLSSEPDTKLHSSNNDDEDENEDEDEEPQLKYASLTKAQGALYRGGDAASAFLVAGDKMVRSFKTRRRG